MIERNNSKFFQNRDCEYWMCHEGVDEDTFSCLFCYCPWFYHCGSKELTPCETCTVPHHGDSYDMIIRGIKAIRGSLNDTNKSELK